MKNATRQLVRHFHHKHSRFYQHLLEEDKLKAAEEAAVAVASVTTTDITPNISANFTHHLETTANNCYSTNQVLLIIAVTCFLNFAFIILIMMCVQILGSTGKEHDCSDEDPLILNEEQDDFGLLDESDGISTWESSKLRVASFPDNIITRKVTERLLRAKKPKAKNRYHECDIGYAQHLQQPTFARTYHFGADRFCDDEGDTESDVDIRKYERDYRYSWDDYGIDYAAVGIEPRKHHFRDYSP